VTTLSASRLAPKPATSYLCESSLEWPSRGVRYTLPECDYIQDVLFQADGSVLSPWLDATENERRLKLLRWLPDEAEPREAIVELGALDFGCAPTDGPPCFDGTYEVEFIVRTCVARILS
jgi:hypothetical protein